MSYLATDGSVSKIGMPSANSVASRLQIRYQRQLSLANQPYGSMLFSAAIAILQSPMRVTD